MRALGGGVLYLAASEFTRQRMNEKILNNLKPLLMEQDYVKDVELHYGQSCKFDLDSWRYVPGHLYCPFRSLAERHLLEFGLSPKELDKPWLEVEPKAVFPVIIHRSPRYRNENFPWQEVLSRYRGEIAFIGQLGECTEFKQRFSAKIPYLPTRDFHELAQVIAGSRLFIGNQSAPFAIAEGLKKRVIQETWLQSPDCLFPRKDAQFVVGRQIDLPKI